MKLNALSKGLTLIMTLMAALAVNAQEGDATAGEGKTQVCVACHGADGNVSSLPNVPRLGGQNERYLLKQLLEIKSGAREVPLMSGMLANHNEQDLADVAAFYASQPEPQGATDPAVLALGQEIYRAGIPEAGVAACSACHSPTGSGNRAAGFPALSGQLQAYTEAQLQAFRAETRANDDAEVMRSLSHRLTDAEISAVASFVSGLR